MVGNALNAIPSDPPTSSATPPCASFVKQPIPDPERVKDAYDFF
jgi:hypothetical protein